MTDTIYKNFIKPRSNDRDVRPREFVLNVLLVGSVFFVLCGLVVNTFVSLLILHHKFVVRFYPEMLGLLLFFGVLYILARKGMFRFSALIMVGLYSLVAIGLVAQSGVLIPQGILTFALVVVLSGILLGSRYAFIISLVVTAVLGLFLELQINHVVTPDISWGKTYGEVADVIAFGGTFVIIGLVVWLYNWQMERSLKRAQESERALKRQKSLLEITVEERTKELQAAQAQKMKQFYHFAELGHVSTALLHDLSNHLAMLTLDIETLDKPGSNKSAIIKQSRSSITYIEQLVQRVRFQLQGESIVKQFNIVDEIGEAMQLIAYRASKEHVTLELVTDQEREAFTYTGDFVGFRQLMGNILTNSIEAYDTAKTPADKRARRQVNVSVQQTDSRIIIAITDWGRGIKSAELNKIFEPFYSTREAGMGIGLFIAKQLVEDKFKGRLTATSKPKVGTIFTIDLPRRAKKAA